MKATHACVWIDHREAKIVSVSRDAADETVLHDQVAPRHIHHKADTIGSGKAAPDHAFFDEVAAALATYKGVLIVGPGQARTQFAGYVTDKHPLLAKRIWGIEPMDHPTDAQLAASAIKYFHAEDRMHS